MATRRVAVVGSFVVGLTLRTDVFPVSGQTVLARDFDMGPGGKGSNQAVQIARLGGEVEFIGLIGEDDFGQIATRLFDEEGVGRGQLHTTAERHTGVGFIVLDPEGDNRILLDPGSNDLFSSDHVQRSRASIAAAAVVIAQLEIPTEAAAAGLALGKEVGATTILNPAPVRPIPAEVFASIDILTPNQSEARVLLGLSPEDPRDDREVSDRLLELGVQTVVMTRGAEGAAIIDGSGTTFVPAFQVDPVDTTGAGDAFNGALAAALAAGDALDIAVRRGTAAGALACTRLGVIPALPDAQELDDLLAGP
jgi:ribokinase